jgi:hypothetical protein
MWLAREWAGLAITTNPRCPHSNRCEAEGGLVPVLTRGLLKSVTRPAARTAPRREGGGLLKSVTVSALPLLAPPGRGWVPAIKSVMPNQRLPGPEKPPPARLVLMPIVPVPAAATH